MKTTCTPKTTNAELIDSETSKVVGTIKLPQYEEMPKVIVVGDVIYVASSSYTYGRHVYKTAELIHVATAEDVIRPEAEAAAAPAA